VSNKSQDNRKSRRQFLLECGGSTISMAAIMVAGGSRLFASNFFKKVPVSLTPDVRYDPRRQIMVDVKTGEPAYNLAQTGSTSQEWTARVTPTPEGPQGDGKQDTVTDD